MDGSSLCCILVSVHLLLVFLAVVVFVEPAAFFGSEEVDFCGLTGVFFTLDMLPLIFLLFQNDSKVGAQRTEFGTLYPLWVMSVDFLPSGLSSELTVANEDSYCLKAFGVYETFVFVWNWMPR